MRDENGGTAPNPAAPCPRPGTPGRWLEFALLYGILPSLAIAGIVPVSIIPLLMLAGAYCVIRLCLDPSFDRSLLRPLHRLDMPGTMRHILPMGLLVAVAMTGLVWMDDHGSLFALPRERPLLWLLIMILYPLLSVWPQEIIYRVYFFQRFDRLFGRPAWANLAGAVLFGLHHWVFHNWIAVALSIIGGWRFALTYRRTRSLGAVCLEHALYGCLLFTIGLGRYFFNGVHRMAEQVLQTPP